MKLLRPLRLLSVLDRKRQDPEKFVFTGDAVIGNIDIQLFKFNKYECVETRDLLPQAIERFDSNKFNNWLNVYGLSQPEAIVAICEKQGIHNLVIQDILDVNQRPKFQEFEKFSFLTLRSIISPENEMISEQVSFVFGANFLISFQERKAEFFEHLRYRLREDKGMARERGPDYLLYTMLESILDNYFKTLNKLDQDIEKFDFTDNEKEPMPNALAIIESHKKLVHFIQKSILPIKEFAQIVERGGCQLIEQRHVKYFFEIKDLCLSLLDSCDIILSSAESSKNLFFSMQGHRMNQVMKTLTIVATIFIPLTFLAGIYGMNFSNMPELEWKYGYFATWGVFVLVFLGMVFYFKRRKWF